MINIRSKTKDQTSGQRQKINENEDLKKAYRSKFMKQSKKNNVAHHEEDASLSISELPSGKLCTFQ